MAAITTIKNINNNANNAERVQNLDSTETGADHGLRRTRSGSKRRALRADEPPRYERASRPSKLEPFKEEIHELLRGEPKLTGVRIRELIEPLGFDGGKSIVDDYLREVRPLFLTPRTFQRTIYRPGEICQFDLWQPAREIPVGHGQTRKGYVVVALLG